MMDVAVPAMPTFGDAEKARMFELIGVATVMLNRSEITVSDDDRRQVAELVGLLASLAFNEILFAAVAALDRRTQQTETQLAAVQRQNANPN